MTKPRAAIVRSDRRIAVQIDTLCHLFDVAPTTIHRAVAAGKLKPSSTLGPVLYNVNDVEKLLFPDDSQPAAPAASAGPGRGPTIDPSVQAVHEKTKSRNGTAAGHPHRPN